MRILRSIFLLSGLAACHPGMLGDPAIVVTTDPEFRVAAYEQRDSVNGAAALGLWVESVALYDCAGYRIQAEVRQVGQQIEIDLLDVLAPATCTGPPTPARQFVPLSQLAPGAYALRLTLGKTLVNEGTYNVTEQQVALSFSQMQGVEIQNYTTYRLSGALLWGYAPVPDEAANTAAQSFLTDLKAITSDPGLAPGFYSYFTVSGTGTVFFHSSIVPGGPAFPFVRKLTAPPSALKTLLQQYRAGGGQQEPLAVRCFSTLGEF